MWLFRSTAQMLQPWQAHIRRSYVSSSRSLLLARSLTTSSTKPDAEPPTPGATATAAATDGHDDVHQYNDLIEDAGSSRTAVSAPATTETATTTSAEKAGVKLPPPCLEEVRIWDELGRHYPAPNAGIWVGNLYPDWHFGLLLEIARVPVRFLSGGRWILLQESQRKVDAQLLKTLTAGNLRPVRLIPRVREAGAFVYFPSAERADRALLLLQQQGGYLTRRLLGDPFFEDLYFRPSKKLRLHNVAGKKISMTQEELFNLLRSYGRLREVVVDAAKSEYAEAVFVSSASAICARNCLHGMPMKSDDGGTLLIDFQEYSQWKQLHALWDYLKSPRLLPFLALALAFCLLAMIEPFRLVNVAQTLAIKRSPREHHTDRAELDSFLPFYPVDCPVVRRIKKQFKRPPNGIIVIQGPKGTGKTRLLTHICQQRAYSLRVDCSPNSQNEAATIETFVATLERTVGFRPSFRFINSMLAFAESFLPKGNQLTQTSTVALNKVLLGLQRSLTFLSLTAGRSRDYVYPVIVFDSFHELLDYLYEHSAAQNPSQMQRNVVDWAVLVAQHLKTAHIVFVTDTNVPNDYIASYQPAQTKIRSYTIPDLTEDQAVAFISEMLTVRPDELQQQQQQQQQQLQQEQLQQMQQQLEQNRLESGSLLDVVSPSSGSWFSTFRTVLTGGWRASNAPVELPSMPSERIIDWDSEDSSSADIRDQIRAAVGVLGGRISDLCSFVTRVNDGASMPSALRAMLKDQRGTVLRVGFADHPHDHGAVGKKWTNFQLWQCLEAVVKSPGNEVPEAIVANSFFEGDSVPYYAVLKTGLLERVEKPCASGSGTVVVRAGSPLLLAVFNALCKSEDRLVFQKMRLTALAEKARKKLRAAEEELGLLTPPPHSEAFAAGQEEIAQRRKRVAVDIAKYGQKLAVAEDALDAFSEALKRGEIPP